MTINTKESSAINPSSGIAHNLHLITREIIGVIIAAPTANVSTFLQSGYGFIVDELSQSDCRYILENPCGSKIIVTHQTDTCLPELMQDVLVALYDAQSNPVDLLVLVTPKEAAVDPVSIAGTQENIHALRSLILWLSDNINLEIAITFSNEGEPLIQSEQAIAAIKANLPQFASLQA